MTRPWRPASGHFQSGGSRVTSSRDAGMEEGGEEEEEEDKAPIFSLSKSSMDVLTAAGPPCRRDPAWTRLDLRRSSSASSDAHRNALSPQEPGAGTPQRSTTTNSCRAPGAGRRAPTRSSAPVAERWLANVERWSVYSQDAFLWRGGATQEAPPSSAPDSPLTTPSPSISPLQTPPAVPSNTRLPSPPKPPPPPPPAYTELSPSPTASPPPTPSSLQPPQTPEPTGTSTPRPATPPSPSASLEERGGAERISPEIGRLVDVAVCKEDEAALSLSSGSSLPLGSWAGSPEDALQEAREETRGGEFFYQLELPWLPGRSSSPTGSSLCRGQRSPLTSSLSDSLLDGYSRCHHSRIEIVNWIASPVGRGGGAFREDGPATSEEGTMTSRRELVDASVQTVSPPDSWWNMCRRHLSYLPSAHPSSHSILGSPPGSPPGSRLNLKLSAGSSANLVSPSSSMFPGPEGEEDRDSDVVWEASSPPLYHGERRRSILKAQGEEREELGRRSSMKQVQWDEEGLTWDVYGASLDPLELSTAIQTHLSLKTGKTQDSPSPQRTTKRKTAETPSIATATTPVAREPGPPKAVDTSIAEGEKEVRWRAEGEGEREKEGDRKGRREEHACNSKAGGERDKEDGVKGEKKGGRGEGGPCHHKTLSRGSRRGVMRSLKRPGWCGGKANR